MGTGSKDVNIAKLSSNTGAEVTGVDLARSLPPELRERLTRAFVEHSVLVIRDQKLEAPQFLAAMQNFGEVFPQHNPRFAVPECPLVHYISNQDKLEDGRVYIPGEGYHTDHSNDAIPPKATALHAVKLPATGGDTQFVNMHEAYDALPETMNSTYLAQVLEFLATMPPEDREAVILVAIKGYKIESEDPDEETAATLCGVSGRAIRKRLKKAGMQLKKFQQE
jgi:alpha-ketoglutarate-dependent taurine dioxygenase